ncbi:MAG TPA: PAS domain S-box protein, partial [Acidimicrobiales bacterium]|nr:PAS domain S-box protein [Acidimicrobiales bacterium]
MDPEAPTTATTAPGSPDTDPGAGTGAPRASFAARFYGHAADPALLANLPVALIFCLFRWLGLIAPEPYWLYVGVVVGGGVVSVLASMLWSSEGRRPDPEIHTAVTMAVIATVAYSTGWGPILSIGFLFGAASGIQHFGSRAVRPSVLWTGVAVGLGQLAIALHLAPSLVRAPLVHGIAALGLLGALLVTALLGRATAERERIEAELRQSERRFRALVTHAADIILVTDQQGLLQYVSPAFERILGYSAETHRNESMGAFLHADDLRRMNLEFPPLLRDPSIVLRTVLRGRDVEGRWRHFETTVTNRLDDPDVQGIVGNLHDISELRQADERFRSAFENAPIGMAMTDLTGIVLRANPAMGRIVGRRPDDLVGMDIAALTHPDDRASTKAEMRRLVDAGTDGYRIEKRYIHTGGNEIWVSVSVSCVRDDQGAPLYLIGQVEDVTERRALREHLAYAAIHDPLTKLPNRELFMDRLTTALHRSERTGRSTAVVFLDLDRFKLINDSLGHEAGDRVLEVVAGRLARAMRQSDTLARFGGDEFTVLCEELHGSDDAMIVAQRLVQALEEPVAAQGGEVFVSFSAGVALAQPGEPGAATLRKADIAMYRAKERGRSHVELYREDDEDRVVSRLRTSTELHRALERDELVLHYQPVVDLHTESLVGMEALVRWHHPS